MELKENQPLVSFIMNCYNGEQYLKRSLDSIIGQTYSNWELIFWDNCSTDRSKEIFDSYKEPRFKYFRSEKNVNLGQARAWAVEKCQGDYIAFLDVDDEWFPKKTEIQVTEMQKDDYVLSVTGLYNTPEDDHSDKRPFHIPDSSGYLFEKELINFNIGMVESMIKREALIKKGLNFDPEVKASEEYCLFMQLIYDEKICVVPEILAQYYFHKNSLTNKSIDRWYIERFYTLNKILEKHPEAEQRYPQAFVEARARGYYYKARYLHSIGNIKAARECLKGIRKVNRKYMLLYLLTFFPAAVWNKVHTIKDRR